MSMRTGIMGGTFNPVHNAHILLAQVAYDECKLDRVLFVPTSRPAYKENNNILPDELRLSMVEASLQSKDHMQVSDVDIERKGYTYTVDTLDELKILYPEDEFYFIMGADSLENMTKWYHFEQIFKKCSIIAAMRPGCDNSYVESVRNNLVERYNASIYMIDMPQLDISSTKIRDDFVGNKSIEDRMPPEALKILYDNETLAKEVW